MGERRKMVARGRGKGGIQLPAALESIDIKKIKIGLIVATVTMLVILIICYATFGWLVDYTSAKCSTSLSESKCSGSTNKLSGKLKDEGETMAGLGAMAWIFMFVNLIILVILILGKLQSYQKIMLIAGMALVGLTWLFLTAGWGRFADSNGGGEGSVDFGASFAFTVITWLCLFPYGFFWFLLFNRSNDADSDKANQPQAQVDGTPDQSAYNDAPTYTVDSSAKPAGATATAGDDTTKPQENAPAHEEPAGVQNNMA